MLGGFEHFRAVLDPPSSAFPETERRRRCGIALARLLATEAEASRFGLSEAQPTMREVLPGNRTPFEKLGYEVIAIDPHPRSPEQNTLRLRKPLN